MIKLYVLFLVFLPISAHDKTIHPCPRGSFRAIDPHVCQLCPKGYYGSTSGLTDPLCSDACPIGTYNDKYGAQTVDDCIDCPAGYFGSLIGQTDKGCTGKCAIGTYSKLTGQTSQAGCTACLPKYYMYQCNSEQQYAAGVGLVVPRAALRTA